MCMVLFLGTDADLEPTEFSPENPAFYVGPLSEHEASVCRHLGGDHVYFLGSHTLCGCGFGYGQDPEYYTWAAQFQDEDDVDPKERVSRRQLADFLHALVDDGHDVDVYACWSGDEGEPPNHQSRVSPEAFLDPASVRERHHLVVTSS